MKNSLKKLLGLLDRDDRRAFAVFIIVSFFAGVIDVAGVSSVMPFIAVLMQPDLVTTNHILSAVYNALHFTNAQQFVMFLGAATLAVTVLGGIINILAVRYQLNLSYKIGHKWATHLFASFLGQPYPYYLNVNSSTMTSAILSEVDRSVSLVVVPVSVAIAKIMVILVILTMLLFVNAAVTITLMLVVGGIYGGLLLYFRQKMRARGQGMVMQNKSRFQITSEAFNGIREIKLYHSTGYFEEKFSRASEEYNMAQAYSLYFGQVPRFVIEIVGFAALIGMALYLVGAGGSSAGQVIPLISLFAAAGYKTLPAAQNLYASLNYIRFNADSLSTVADGIALSALQEKEVLDPDAPLSFKRDITVQDLSFSYEGQSVPALQDVNCTIKKGSLVAVVGQTGAGKSTLIDLLAGLLQPGYGGILVDGLALTSRNTRLWQKQIGYVPQKIHLLDESIGNNIAFAVPEGKIDHAGIAAAAQKSQIDSFIQTLPQQYDTLTGEQGNRLSGGQRQRIGIARALYRDPSVLILDEPTSALDSDTARDLMTTLKELAREKTVIIITHSPEALRYCDQILRIDAGKVYASVGGTTQSVTDEAV